MSTDKTPSNERVLLLCGRTVPKWLYKAILKRVEERYAELLHNRPYTLELVCGKQYWRGLRNQKTNAGLIMAHLVDSDLVPYFFVSERDAKPLWYSLNP